MRKHESRDVSKIKVQRDLKGEDELQNAKSLLSLSGEERHNDVQANQWEGL